MEGPLAKRLRNDVKAGVRHAKANFVQDYIEDEMISVKKFWEKISFVTNSKHQSKIQLIDKTTNLPVSDSDTAMYINTFFTNIGPSLASNFDDNWVDDIAEVQPNMPMLVITDEDIRKTICEIDVHKSSAIENISSRILKDAFEVIVPQLTFLFNMSLRTGTFPTVWKNANIIPLQKNGDKTDVNNLRPISLLPLPGKLLERIVHTRLTSYLEENNLLNTKQNGFRKNRSTISTVADFTDDVLKGLNEKMFTTACFIDLRKAFDTVSHSILKKKILKFGINQNIIKWINDYLTNRQQRCIVNSVTSDYLDITCGVPQGSIMGPLLFLIYLNDITNNLHNSTVRLYADDTVIYTTNNSEDVAHNIISNELDIVTRWCDMNQLTMNLSKTKVMLFGTRNMLKGAHHNAFMINNTPLHYVQIFTYLGIKLDSKLNFEAHANECIRMVSYKLYLLTKI